MFTHVLLTSYNLHRTRQEHFFNYDVSKLLLINYCYIESITQVKIYGIHLKHNFNNINKL